MVTQKNVPPPSTIFEYFFVDFFLAVIRAYVLYYTGKQVNDIFHLFFPFFLFFPLCFLSPVLPNKFFPVFNFCKMVDRIFIPVFVLGMHLEILTERLTEKKTSESLFFSTFSSYLHICCFNHF